MEAKAPRKRGVFCEKGRKCDVFLIDAVKKIVLKSAVDSEKRIEVKL